MIALEELDDVLLVRQVSEVRLYLCQNLFGNDQLSVEFWHFIRSSTFLSVFPCVLHGYAT